VVNVLRIGHASQTVKSTSPRRAVRAVGVRDGKVLMLRSDPAGDFKFPGGGVEEGETDEETLRREVAEECGATVGWVNAPVLEIVETRPDAFHEDVDFQMVSVYVPCSIDDPSRPQRLSDHELALGLTPVWVDPAHVLAVHEGLLSSGAAAPWVSRETHALRWLVQAKVL
jgi:8-oxo-dGTP pyrophosphatase MutT (NUDIX family)